MDKGPELNYQSTYTLGGPGNVQHFQYIEPSGDEKLALSGSAEYKVVVKENIEMGKKLSAALQRGDAEQAGAIAEKMKMTLHNAAKIAPSTARNTIAEAIVIATNVGQEILRGNLKKAQEQARKSTATLETVGGKAGDAGAQGGNGQVGGM